jgi:hypothetical protein
VFVVLSEVKNVMLGMAFDLNALVMEDLQYGSNFLSV